MSDTNQMLGSIYLITCLINGKMYVGQSINEDPESRYTEHWYSALKRGTKSLLYNAMRKYGSKNFHVQLLCNCPYYSLDNMEAYWAEQLETYKWDIPGGFNMVWCGQGCRRGIPHTQETKELQSRLATERSKYVGPKISEALKGRKWSDKQHETHRERMSDPQWKQMISNTHTGKTITPEQREILRNAMRNYWTEERKKVRSEKMKARNFKHSAESKALMSEKLIGKSRSEAHKEKLRIANTGKKASAEARANMSKANTGKTHTEESKEKIGAANKGKRRTEEQKAVISQAKKVAAAEKFRKVFFERFELWKKDPIKMKQWRYDISRKYRDGTLPLDLIDILNITNEWSWSSRKPICNL